MDRGFQMLINSGRAVTLELGNVDISICSQLSRNFTKKNSSGKRKSKRTGYGQLNVLYVA